MTREIGPVNDIAEHHITPMVHGGADPLQQYRMGNIPSETGRSQASPMSGDHMIIPPLHTGGEKSMKQAPGHPTAQAGHDHVVQHKDSLWKIAEQSLDSPGHSKASNGQIWHQVQNIIQANKNEHPELLKNPNLLHDGTKLHIPNEDHTQGNGSQGNGSQGNGHHVEAHHHSGKTKHHKHGTAGHRGNSHPQEDETGSPQHGRRPDSDHEGQPPAKTSNPLGEAASNLGQAVHKAGGDFGHAIDETTGAIGHALSNLGHGLAGIATNVAHHLGTVGDCAHGPRLAFGKLGFHLPPAVATEQGRMIRNSGLFDEVPASQVRPGDYGVRDWNAQVTREHGGVNKGDSFIVTSVGAHGQLYGANDHTFAVPPDGGRYRNLKFYRPNAEFLQRYGANV